jgi:hypothetical protein
MKFRLSLTLLVAALAMSSAAKAHSNECTDSMIRGTYAFTIHGQIFTPNGPILIDGIAKTTFDGEGNLTQVDAVAQNGVIGQVWRPGTGSYKVNADCSGTMTIVNANQPDLHLAILVSRAGEQIHTVVTDAGVAVTSDAERVRLSRWDD